MSRTLELTLAATAAVLFFPLWLPIAVAVKVSSRGPVLYKAERVGKDGVPFRLYKFRTMGADAPTTGPGITARGDPRVTPVGRFLRRWKLDELPQLLNVLAGEMSVVGPRPEDPRYVERYTPEQRRVLTVRPGLTSPAVVHYRHEESTLAAAEDPEAAYLTSVLPNKLQLDLDYVAQRSLLVDLRVLATTLASMFSSPGR